MRSSTFDEFRRGWRVLLAAAVGNGAGVTGIPFFTFSVFVVPLTAATGWTRGAVSRGASCLLVGTVISAPLVGWIIDRVGARRVAIASMLALAIGYLLLTRLSGSVTHFYLAWGAIALAAGGTNPVVWTRAVSVWFDRARGLALGIALAGSGVAGVLAPLVTNRVIDAFGWQGAYLVLGMFIGVIAVPILLVFFHERRDGLEARTVRSSAEVPSLPGLTLHQAVRTLPFWKIGLGFLFVASVVSGVIINLVPLLIDRGMSPAGAASVAGVLGLAVMFGRLGTGYLLDRFPGPLVAVVLIALAAGGCVLLTLPDLPAWMVSLAAISVGLCSAAEADLVSYLSGRFLGMRAYGRIFGWQLSMYFLGAALGPLAAGYAYDHFHSYVPTLEISTVSLLVGAVVLGSLGRPPRFTFETATASR